MDKIPKNRYRTPAQKLKAAEDLYWNAKALKAAYIRVTHPEWSEEQVHTYVKEWMLYART